MLQKERHHRQPEDYVDTAEEIATLNKNHSNLIACLSIILLHGTALFFSFVKKPMQPNRGSLLVFLRRKHFWRVWKKVSGQVESDPFFYIQLIIVILTSGQ